MASANRRLRIILIFLTFKASTWCGIVYGFSDPTQSGLRSAPELEPAGLSDVREEVAANLEDEVEKLMRSATRSFMPVVEEVMAQGTVSSACLSSLLAVFKALMRFEVWALKFVDSMGVPAGVLELSSGSLGRYDECVSIVAPESANHSQVAFRGSFCSVYLKTEGNPFLRKLYRRIFESTPLLRKHVTSFEELERLQESPRLSGLRAALCVPSKCTATDVESFLSTATKPYGVKVQVPVCKGSSVATLGADQVFALCALICLLLVVALASAMDLWLRYSPKDQQAAEKVPTMTKGILAFSAVTNTQQLFSAGASVQGSWLRCLDGVRFLSALWILCVHNYVMFDPDSLGNTLDALGLRANLGLTFLFSGFLSIETFFLLSGFLTAYAVFKETRQNKPPEPWPLKVWRRYVRFTGPPLILILIMFVYPVLMNGPVADQQKEACVLRPCRESWWYLMLQVVNIRHMNGMYASHMWFLSCNFQIYLTCFGFVVLMKRRALIGGACLTVISAAALVAVGAQVYWFRYDGYLFMRFKDIENATIHFERVYSMPHQHIVSFVVGVFEAYVFTHKELWSQCKMPVVRLWIIALGITTFLCLFPNAFDSGAIAYDPTVAALYASLYPLLWSVSVGWMLHSCLTGTAGLVKRFLSLGVFTALGKTVFSLYLVHPYVLFAKLLTQRQFRSLDQWSMLTGAAELFAMSSIFAFAFHIICECPIMNLDKIVTDAFLQRKKGDKKFGLPTVTVHTNNLEMSGCNA